MTYSPELGQAMFGAKWEEQETPPYVTSGIDVLADRISEHRGTEASLASNDGEPEYRSDVFVMRAYSWADCTCGFDEKDWEAERELKADQYGLGWSERHDRLTEWAKENGYPDAPNGMAVHCDCGLQNDYAAWREKNDHADDCLPTLPNFEHFASALRVHWYKHSHRGSSVNRPVGVSEWANVLTDCLASVPPGRCDHLRIPKEHPWAKDNPRFNGYWECSLCGAYGLLGDDA